MSLPKQCLYTNKINSSYSKNFQSAIAPQNGSEYNLGETVIINIPCSQNLVMSAADTILKFNLNFRNATAGAVTYRLNRSGAYAVIQRVRIFAGNSVLLSDIDAYGNLMDMLISCQQSSDSVGGKLNIMAGTEVTAQNVTVATGTNVVLNFAIPFVSILSWTNNYVPLFVMTGPLRLELQLVTDIKQIIHSSAALTFHSANKIVDNVELVCNFMEISDTGMSIIRRSLGDQPLQWVCQDYRNYQTTTVLKGGAQTQLSTPVPAKFNSLNSLFWTIRQNHSGVATFPANESTSFLLKEYYVRLGAKTIPTKPCNTYPEFFCELMRAFGSVSDVNVESNIKAITYTKAYPNIATNDAAITGETGCFYGGLDLESYSNCDMSNCYTGYNSSTDDIFFTPTFNPQVAVGNVNAGAADQNIRVDVYALYDVLITLENGVARVNV